MSELKLRPFKGMFSTNRLPITVLTDASEALSSGALPSTVMRFDGAADGQREIQPCALVHFQDDASLVNGFESGGLYRDVVRAGQEGGDAVLAFLVGEDGAGSAGVGALHDDPASGTARSEGSVIKPESSAFWASKGMVSRVRAGDCFQTRLKHGKAVAALFFASISASLGRASEPLVGTSLQPLTYARCSAGLTEPRPRVSGFHAELTAGVWIDYNAANATRIPSKE